MKGLAALPLALFASALIASGLGCSAKEVTQKRLGELAVPEGFTITRYASVPGARSLARGDKGTIFVGNRGGSNTVYAVVDENKDGVSDRVVTIARGLNAPNGVAFKEGSLYVAEINRIIRFDDIEDRLSNPPEPVVVFDGYPTEGHHGWKFIAFGPDGKLYVPVGAPCNICEKKDPVFASITRINDNGTGMEIYAHGVRNTVGFDWHPDTGELWFTDNGRDRLGDDSPGDELNRAEKEDEHFGFPFCHAGDVPDPDFGSKRKCSEFKKPFRVLGPHVAALGMRFYTGESFPEEYRGKIFIAEHGSWNRSSKVGYRITIVDPETGDYKPFVTGWLQGEEAWGRPVDLLVMPDGSLLVSDDKAGAIYRIEYD